MPDTPSPDAPLAGSECYHCGLPVPAGLSIAVKIDGIARAMCCAGCQAVAQTIVDHGLTSYYRQRSALPLRDDSVPQVLRELAAYDIPEVESELAREVGEHAREVTLMLEGITCAACVWLIEQRVGRVPGVLGIEINYATHRARVRWDARRTRLAAILAAVAALGYRAYPYDPARAEQSRRRERDRALWRLFVAGFGMMQVMMYLVPIYVTNGEMTVDVEQLMRIASLILTLPVVLYAAAPFFTGAWRDLRVMQPGMDVPVALGIAAAFAASVVATVTGSGQVYFDSVTMFVFLLLAARYLEMTVRMRAVTTQEELARPAPAVAERFAAWPDTATTMVAAASLRSGDFVRVRPGSAVPADGVVVAGESELDERLLTGESRPQAKRAGDALIGSSFNLGSPLVMRITRVGTDTVLAGILRLLDRAVAERPRIARSADRVAQHFVLALLAVAAVVAVLWYQIDPARALWITVAVLVVSCPCALSLATPAAIAAATGALHERGVLVTRGDAIENLARATDFVFDKTGTLTSGAMRLTGVIPLETSGRRHTPDECLKLAAALEAGSSHPIARALVAAAPADLPRCETASKSTLGAGVEATLGGTRTRIGTADYVAALGRHAVPGELASLADDVTAVALGDERGWIALFTFADPVRAHARSVVHELTAMGKTVHLLSGDRPQIVAHVARNLGIAAQLGGVTPDAKLAYVQRLQAAGAVVAMIGDGVNDAAGLGAADVAVAMGGGADITCGNSDVILLANQLDALLVGVRKARASLRVIRQNLAWAFAYNVVAIPLAACGYVSPLLAGVGMAASSTVVVANALRLLRHAPRTAATRAARLAHAR
jgi:P-type Cu2+ transporter